MTKKHPIAGAAGDRNGILFPLGPGKTPDPEFIRPKQPIWTKNKAKLIERYLRYFVFVTQNGAYIDGFAGPQEENTDPELWSASLVLRNEPRRLRKFFLFDQKPKQVARLNALRDSELPFHPKSHLIEVAEGDFNLKVTELLERRPIRDKEASFCLLDQRTFECHWATVERIAQYKPPEHMKIEQFYFYPQGWIDRALTALRNTSVLRAWWGRDDIDALKQMNSTERIAVMVDRFKKDLGYKYVTPWPIRSKPDSAGRIMYQMIHATDHDAAPKLMSRAYRSAVDPREPVDELQLELGSLYEAGDKEDDEEDSE